MSASWSIEGNENLGREQAHGDSPRSCGMACAPQNISTIEQWISVGAGTALLMTGVARGRISGLFLGLLGGALIHRGATGHCYGFDLLGIDTAEHGEATAVPAQQGVKFVRTVSINRPVADLYSFWRDLENLPAIMRHLQEVRVVDDRKSRWVADGIGGGKIEWEAEIINEKENELIAWRSLPGGDLETAGSVHFRPIASNHGTEVTVTLKYNPPGGKLGAGIASLLGAGVEHKIAEDLRRFKQWMESGEVPSAGDRTRLGESTPSTGEF
jgi:uncharacterized membrane protein